ncbi:M16 family metallopeptidase [Granulicella mallensis]|uniref:Peptidase M16 domain protein n=1 Tax=Granulicella mallensis (strain ATCC BAA-1857 / DSM 23137 / MP5ACTX8) TaxID=682795 RepID=G8P1K2_GRAMM|nr:pitrilysin family protein [Granulicella mallensis]AEU34741.1 peptidase M16 domain protein [Granulicella mallensis MP5ACTX8]
MSMDLKKGLAAAMAVCFAIGGSAISQTNGKLKLPEIKYETYTLPNGLKVITHEDHRLPLVAVDLWYHVGPLNERPGRTGFAHLFEHMMFEGSEHVGEKAHIKYVQGAGATDVNGTTDFDRTNYFETLPANQLELGLWLESDRMGFLMEGLNRDLLRNQRDVVRNERRQGEGSPYAAADEAVAHLLYPKGHPYYGDVIGSHADIEAARIADIRDFHQQFYTPNNASIAIAGDFDPAKLKELLTKYFGPIPAGPKVDPVTVVTPPITSQRRQTVTDTVKLPQLNIAWLTPAAYTPGSYDVSAAIFALGGAKASRLDEALVYKTQVAQSVTCYSRPNKLNGTAECSVIAKPGVKLEDLEATVWAEIAKLQTEGPTAAEVEAAKAGSLTQKINGLQRLGGFGGVADTLDEYNQYTGDPGYLPKDIAAAEAVSVASTKAAAARYLTKDTAVVVYCVPGKKVLDDVPRSPEDTDANVKITNPYTPEFETAQEWRKTVPKAGPPVTVHLPVPQTFTLANGLKVYVVEESSLPVLSATLVARAGSENNPSGKEGLASLTSQTMGEATTTRDLKQLADAQERIGTRIGVGSSMDGSTASMTVLTNHTREGFDLLSDVVEHPAFKVEDLDRLRKQRLIGIQQETDSVSAMAQRVGPKLVYGDQPYGHSQTGTNESVTGLTRDDVTGFYADHYGPADSALVLVGDVTPAEARKLAEQYFGKWTGKATAAITLPSAPTLTPTHVVIVDKPGAPQSALIAYGLGVPGNSPDLQPLQVMNYVLGGSFASRINMNLREVHGYTYGASSNYSLYRGGGPFQAGGLVRTDVTGPAAKELMTEIRRFPSTPPTEAELNEAKTARIQSLPGQFETTGSIASSMGSIFLYDRPLDYYATLPEKYRAVTAANVERVAKEDVHPDELIIVAAGDRTKIEPQLKDAGLGPVEVRDINGKLVTDAK